jgi:glycosyltransferase involved in cell wall biosynthesis
MIKDLETLLRAFKVVQGEIKSAVLLIAGDGPVREKMMVLAQSLGISEAVIFLGWRHDLPILYRTMDIFLLSSRNEGTPVSVIEAMAAGLPVVATNVGGVPDLVNPGNSGLLVPAGDPVAMADAVFRLAGDTHTRTAMGTEGRNIAKTRYTSERLVQDVDRLYRDGVAAKCGVG